MVIAPFTITQCCAILDENEIRLSLCGIHSLASVQGKEKKKHFFKIRKLFTGHVFRKHFDLPAGT